MDCAAEEQLVRMALDGMDEVRGLSFDLPARTLCVWHEGEAHLVTRKLDPLALGAVLSETEEAQPPPTEAGMAADDATEARTLWILLAINAVMFVVELVAAEITQHFRPEPIVEPERLPAPIVASSSPDDTGNFKLGEIGMDEADGGAANLAEVPGDDTELGAEHGEAVDPAEGLAESALLVRRMLGLYDRTLDPQ